MTKQTLITLFSQSRLQGYTSLAEHEANLALIGSISHKIGILEIITRNKIDSIMASHNELWLQDLPSHIESKGDLETMSRDKFISAQSLGFWLKIIEHYKIHNQIFPFEFLDNLNFKKYYPKNHRYFISTSILRHHKVKAILQLFRLIRNRAFHFENLYKMNEKGPRLSTKITNRYDESVIISILPSKIIEFLNDLIASFDKKLVQYAERKDKGGDKCPLENERIIHKKLDTKLKQGK